MAVQQGKEADHFLSIFRGKLIIRKGDHIPRRRVTFNVSALSAGFGDFVYVCGDAYALGEISFFFSSFLKILILSCLHCIARQMQIMAKNI